MEELNFFDISILVILGLSTLFGFARGIIKEVFTIINVVLAGVVTAYASTPVAEALAENGYSKMMQYSVAVVGIFLLAWLIISITSGIIIDMLSKYRGNAADRTVGMVFGVVRGVFMIIIIYLGIHTIYQEEDNYPEFFTQAKSYNFIRINTTAILGEELETVMANSFNATGDVLKEMLPKSEEQEQEDEDGYITINTDDKTITINTEDALDKVIENLQNAKE